MSWDEDVNAARKWLVGVGVEVGRVANRHDAIVTNCVDQLNVLAAIAELPDYMILRVRCTPNVFTFKA